MTSWCSPADRNWRSLTPDRFTKSMGQWCDATKPAKYSIIAGTVLRLWARHTSRAPTQLRRRFDDLFPSNPQGPPRPHATFKTFADAEPSILTIGVLTAKRRSDVGSDHVVLVLFASISIFQTRPPIR